MTVQPDRHLDGNAAAGPLSELFAVDVTAAAGRCGGCGNTSRFADTHVYMDSPGLVARCRVCETVLMRLVSDGRRTWLDVRGLTYLQFTTGT